MAGRRPSAESRHRTHYLCFNHSSGFLDLWVTLYQAICFPIYRVSKVRKALSIYPVAALGEASKKVLAPVLNKVAVPVLTQVISAPQQIVAKLPIDISKKAIEDRTKKSGQSFVKADAAQSYGASTRMGDQRAISQDQSLADSVSIEDDLLLKFAVIDTTKGVGRSWW